MVGWESFLSFYFRVCAFSIQRTWPSRSLEQAMILCVCESDPIKCFILFLCYRRKFSLDGLIASSLHNWLSFDQVKSCQWTRLAGSIDFQKRQSTSCLTAFLLSFYTCSLQADSELIHKLNAACLKSFLMVTGPTIDLAEGSVWQPFRLCILKKYNIVHHNVAVKFSSFAATALLDLLFIPLFLLFKAFSYK